MEWLRRLFLPRPASAWQVAPGPGVPPPDDESDIREAARSPLSGDDEAVCHRLCELLEACQRWEDAAHIEIRRIGEQLSADGGYRRMRQIDYRVHALGGATRLLAMIWDGIAEWHG